MTSTQTARTTATGLGRLRFEAADAAGIIAVAAVVLAAALGLLFVVRGELNADEGWYLYASRLVYRGQLPYRDFSFTQMPLLPYVYGLVQLVKPSLYLGRIVSVAFAMGAVVLCVRVAWREANRFGAAAVALLCLAAPTAIYNLTLTKTYALVAFFLAALLATLTSPAPRTRTLPLATAAAVGLALSRTSGIPLAVIVVVYALWRAPDARTRLWVAFIAGAGAVVTLVLVLLDPSAARFDLYSFHQLLWYHAPTSTRIDTIFTTRIPDWFGEYWGYVLLWVAAIVAVVTSADLRGYVRRHVEYLILTVGLVIYLAVQLPAGQFAPVEYAAPVIPVVIAVPVILIARRLFTADDRLAVGPALAVGAGALVVLLAVLTAVHPSARGYFVTEGAPKSVAAANRVAGYVKANTAPGDEVLALWGQPATYAADRDLVPGVTFGAFSYEDLSSPDAQAYHYVNRGQLRSIIESRRPTLIVLTGVDDLVFGLRGSLSNRHADRADLATALAAGYHKVHSDVGLGINGATNVDVYRRNRGR
jgi:hypothetical protein